MIRTFKTRTGCIFCDTRNQLEYLYVGDYGKENNIKADFLGLTKEINGVEHHGVNLTEKMVVTISTQKGCAMNCKFCDCPKVGCKGNASVFEMRMEVITAMIFAKCDFTLRFNLHLARMGEPSLNYKNVALYLQNYLRNDVKMYMDAKVIHPVFTTMLPKILGVDRLRDILLDFCRIKNEVYKGEAGLQLSINSTDEAQRKDLFRGKSLSLYEISRICRDLPMPVGRKYTLNFPVTKETKLEVSVLDSLFDKEKFIVKITPIHETKEALKNGIQTEEGYYTYDVYKQFEQPLVRAGWDVIVFVPSKEEDEDRITCGNALLSYNEEFGFCDD